MATAGCLLVGPFAGWRRIGDRLDGDGWIVHRVESADAAVSLLDDFPELAAVVLSAGSRGGPADALRRRVERADTRADLVELPSGWDPEDRAVKTPDESLLDELVRQLDLLRARRLIDDLHLVVRDPRMLEIFERIVKIGQTKITVLITGESGTGKEQLARALHYASRREHPFVAVNVAGLDDHLFSDTLFGHVKGAFSGADEERLGQIAVAGEGTLLLDEIGDLSPRLQTKLLRLLEEGEYNRLGSDEVQKLRARVVAATNADLEAKVKNGGFRSDLYYRLEHMKLHVPPLRERREEIPALVTHFLQLCCEREGRPPVEVDDEVMELLAAHDWTGNVRELRNTVERYVVGSLETADLMETLGASAPCSSLNKKELQLLLDEAARVLDPWKNRPEICEGLVEKDTGKGPGTENHRVRSLLGGAFGLSDKQTKNVRLIRKELRRLLRKLHEDSDTLDASAEILRVVANCPRHLYRYLISGNPYGPELDRILRQYQEPALTGRQKSALVGTFLVIVVVGLTVLSLPPRPPDAPAPQGFEIDQAKIQGRFLSFRDRLITSRMDLDRYGLDPMRFRALLSVANPSSVSPQQGAIGHYDRAEYEVDLEMSERVGTFRDEIHSVDGHPDVVGLDSWEMTRLPGEATASGFAFELRADQPSTHVRYRKIYEDGFQYHEGRVDRFSQRPAPGYHSDGGYHFDKTTRAAQFSMDFTPLDPEIRPRRDTVAAYLLHGSNVYPLKCEFGRSEDGIGFVLIQASEIRAQSIIVLDWEWPHERNVMRARAVSKQTQPQAEQPDRQKHPFDPGD